MKKLLKLSLTLGIIFVFAGGLIFLIGFASSGFNFDTLSGINTETVTKAETEENKYDKIVIDFSISDITVVFDPDADNVSVSYPILKNKRGDALTAVTVSENGGTISLKETRLFKYSLITVFYNEKKSKLTVTVPEQRAISLNINADTNDVIFVGNGQLEELTVSVDTADIKAGNSELSVNGAVNIESDTGDVSFRSIAAESLTAEIDTGDLTLRDAMIIKKIDISIDTGDVKLLGNIIAENIEIDTDTGDIDAEDALLDAESIDLSVDTGDIEVKVAGKKSDYNITVEKDTGKVNVTNQTGGTRNLSIEVNTGDCDVFFAE